MSSLDSTVREPEVTDIFVGLGTFSPKTDHRTEVLVFRFGVGLDFFILNFGDQLQR